MSRASSSLFMNHRDCLPLENPNTKAAVQRQERETSIVSSSSSATLVNQSTPEPEATPVKRKRCHGEVECPDRQMESGMLDFGETGRRVPLNPARRRENRHIFLIEENLELNGASSSKNEVLDELPLQPSSISKTISNDQLFKGTELIDLDKPYQFDGNLDSRMNITHEHRGPRAKDFESSYQPTIRKRASQRIISHSPAVNGRQEDFPRYISSQKVPGRPSLATESKEKNPEKSKPVVIIIDDFDEPEPVKQPFRSFEARKEDRRRDVNGFEEVMDEEGMIVIDLDEELEAKLEIEETFQEARRTVKHSTILRNLPFQYPFRQIKQTKWNGVLLTVNETVELKNGSFLKIKTIIENQQTSEITLRGWQLLRNKIFGGMLPKKLNEVCFNFQVDLDDPRPILEQSVVAVQLEDAVQVRQLICTNCPFPAFRYKVPEEFSKVEFRDYNERQQRTKEYVQEHEALTARRKFVTVFKNAISRSMVPEKPGEWISQTRYISRRFESLSRSECTPLHHMPATTIRFQWRGHTILGGSSSWRANPIITSIIQVEDCIKESPVKDNSGPIQFIEGEDGKLKRSETSGGSSLGLASRVRKQADDRVYTFGDSCKLMI
jgi:hypothetical protein